MFWFLDSILNLKCEPVTQGRYQHKIILVDNNDYVSVKLSLSLFRNPHDIAISLTGDAIYVADVAEAGTGGRGNKIHKFEVIRSPSFF